MANGVLKIESYLTNLCQKIATQLSSLFRNFVNTLIHYIRSKTKDLPLHIPKGKQEIISSLMGRPAFREFIRRHAQESGFSVEQVEENTRHYLDEIAADMNYLTFPFWDFVLTWVFQTIFEGLVIDLESLEKLRPAIGQRPIVFVPNHRSHLDYLLLSYVTYCNRFPMPHVVGGINLSFWPFGWIARKSGCFFIRRSFEGNRLYAACVRFYIQEQLWQNNPMEFFIEGGRSRTGKLLPPKMGILSSLVDGFFQGAAEDILFVPTSFTYDSVLEEKSYLAEQAGGVKKDESIWDLLKIHRHLKKRQGKVYIRFGEPISLQDSLGESTQAEQRKKVQELAGQLTYGINKAALVTPMALSSLTLLAHQHRAISWDDFLKQSQLYLDYLKYKGSPLSEPLRKFEKTAFRESLRQLRAKGLLEQHEDDGEILYRIVDHRRGNLDYYKNTSIHFFVSLSVLCRILKKAAPLIAYPELEVQYRSLQQLFHYEFTFSSRQPLTEHLGKLLEYLEENKSIVINKDGIKPINLDLLEGFSRLLQNFFEGYWIVWQSLSSMGTRRWEKRDLLRWLNHKGRIYYLKESIHLPEANFVFNLQNALQSFCDQGYLKTDSEGWGKKQKIYYQRSEPKNPNNLLKSLLTNHVSPGC